jgi:hypothetical protein
MKFSHDIKTIRSVTSHLDNYQIKASTPQEKKSSNCNDCSVHWPNKIGSIDISDRFNICFLYFLKTSETSLSKLTARL